MSDPAFTSFGSQPEPPAQPDSRTDDDAEWRARMAEFGAVLGEPQVFYTARPVREPDAEQRGEASTDPFARLRLGRVLVAIVATALVTVLTVAGAMWWAESSVPERGVRSEKVPADVSSPTGVSERQRRIPSRAELAAQDELAARSMPQFPESAMWPGKLSTRQPSEPIVLPRAPGVGEAGVETGFPQTAEGAMAQLAAITETAMESGTLPGARRVIRHWAMPGGPTTTGWSGVTAMAELLSELQLSSSGSPDLVVDVIPAMGLIKGSVGSGFVVPCLDFEFAVSLEHTLRFGTATCARMVWTDGRWMIGAGTEPADAPSVWPGTDRAYDVGYRDIYQQA
jgi:hypothetical protein